VSDALDEIAGSYRAALQVSTVDGHRYVDKSWRGG